MKKFASLFAVASLILVLPACAKKTKKEEQKTEQAQQEVTHKSIGNDKQLLASILLRSFA